MVPGLVSMAITIADDGERYRRCLQTLSGVS